MNCLRTFASVALVLVCVAAPALAQSNLNPIGARAFVSFDSNTLAATQTFDAVVGAHRFNSVGVGAEVIRLWRGVFARVAGSQFDASGSRVVVFGSDVASLDIPLTVKLRYLEYGAGWRFGDRLAPGVRTRLQPNPRPRRQPVTYVGAGLLSLHYQESSDLSNPSENTDTTFRGFNVYGGVDIPVWKWVTAGAEVQYRSVPDAIGDGGASKAFGETDLGGTTFRVMVGVRK